MSSYSDYLWYFSEIAALERLLKDIPEENVIERLGYESRLSAAREGIKTAPVPSFAQVDDYLSLVPRNRYTWSTFSFSWSDSL